MIAEVSDLTDPSTHHMTQACISSMRQHRHVAILGCTPGTYSCTADLKGWQVCNVDRTWVFAGACPPNTACLFNKQNGSPYCVPPGFHF
ncbi:hypothetical protein H9L39_15548 [Fusarium oxysporum f. sp. albedinis]|nr:hypothetical protein H9L39_15548 [Fusarium oxysporum f. sp. albedinis]